MATGTRGEPATKDKRPRRTSPAVFVREVIAELRKVIWPTRSQLVTYTTAALIFVLIMVALVSGLDWVLQKGIFAIFD